MCYRRGEELKYFCPSIFIYLSTIVPAIWILELNTNRRELLCLYIDIVEENDDSLKQSMLMDLMQATSHLYFWVFLLKPFHLIKVKANELKEAQQACQSVEISEETRNRVEKNEENLNFLDIHVNIALKPDQWTRILEQIVLVVLILGRWLLPKGNLSRDQFSQLMLVYIGMAADIVEIFEAFRESKVMLEPTLTYAVLGVWSWSLLQFCLVLGATHRGKKIRRA